MTDERTNEEINAAIAERLFPDHGGRFGLYPEPYASDLNAALWLVVPEMLKRGFRFSMWDSDNMMAVAFGKTILHIQEAPIGEEPRAICLAALAALDQEGTK